MVVNNNLILELVQHLLNKNKIDSLEAELQAIDLNTLKYTEEESWYEFYCIAAFLKKDRTSALERFHKAYAKYPNSPRIIFSLAQEYEYVGDIKRMKELLDKIELPDISPQHLLLKAKFLYLHSMNEDALETLKSLLPYYYRMGIADDHFVYTRGFPFFGTTWHSLGALFELAGKVDEFAKLTQESNDKLSDHDFDPPMLFLDCVIKNDFDPYITLLESNLNKTTIFQGYAAMKLAVLKSGVAKTFSKANKILDAVVIAKKDEDFLNDVRVLTKCKLAKKFGEAYNSQAYKIQFLTRQPMLLDLEYIFEFRLVDCQELLKVDYQKLKQVN